uniref:C2H2-type domain-containing protein n=1 Tax=Romanomermis culicivorax TaxID=13658 RepID=A0A915IA88_ROMCU
MLLNSSRRKQFKPNKFDENFGDNIMEEAKKQCSANYSTSTINNKNASSSGSGDQNRRTSWIYLPNDLVRNVPRCSSSLEKVNKNVRRSNPMENNDKSDSEFNSNDKRSRQDAISTSPASSTVSPCPTVSMKIDVERDDCGTLSGDYIEHNLKRQSPKISTNHAIIAKNNGDQNPVATAADDDDDNLDNRRFKNRSVSKEKDQCKNSGGHCFKEELNRTIIKRESSPGPDLMPDDRSSRNDDYRRYIYNQNCLSISPKNRTFQCGTGTSIELPPRRSIFSTDRPVPTVVHAPSDLDGNKVVSPTSAIIETPKFLSKNVTPEGKIVQERPSSSSSTLSCNVLPPTSTKDDPPPAPSTIFLPCLYTDSNVPMQIIGYPQTVIPVAVSKRYEKSLGAALSSKHVTLDAVLLAGLTVDVNHVVVPLKTNNGDDSRSKRYDFTRPLTTTTSQENSYKMLERRDVENLEAKILGHSSPCRIQQEENTHNQSTALTAAKSPISRSIMLPPASQNAAFLPALVQQWKMLTSSQHGHRSTKGLLHPPTTTTAQQPSPGQFLLLKAFPCPNCSASFSSQKTLEGHLNFYCLAKPQNPGPSSINNNLLNESISRSNSLNCIASSTNAEKEKNSKNDQKKRKSNTINQVSEIGQSPSNVQPKATKKRPLFLCEICRKAFREKLIFDNHKCDDNRIRFRSILTRNSNSKRHHRHHDIYFRCKFCEYQSQYKGNLKRHVILVHRDEREFTAKNDAASTNNKTIPNE